MQLKTDDACGDLFACSGEGAFYDIPLIVSQRAKKNLIKNLNRTGFT